MEEEKKPVTSEEFNKKIREENGLPEKVEEPPKKTSPVIVVLIIVFVLAFLAGLVLLGLKAYGDIKKTSTNTPDEPEVVNNNDKPEVKEDTIVTLKEEDIKDYDTLIQYFIRIMDTKGILEAKDFSNQEILFSSYALELDNKGSFSSEDLKKAVQKVFGDVKYTDEPIKCRICGNALYKYDSEGKTYEQAPSTDHGHGGEGGLRFKYFFENGTRNETKGTMELNLKIVYAEYMGDVYGPSQNLYLTAEDAAKTKNGVNPAPTDEEAGYGTDEDYKAVYDKYKDKIAVTTFTFEKDSTGNYGFKKVETK